ncbi:T3SS effector HopA1 family protein [Leptolyngbya ohadii]|uniref:T3SS effector HopA1 family protein n=1 Tax=Leptolyngbya ohadii TaxID=1962290 RepID=UPI000B59CFEA|nr:T3SS effector HopA1 family protein [Leptolyngbya ohadii]
MVFLLSNENVLKYLAQLDFCQAEEREQNKKRNQVEARICKNFNLLVHLENGQDLLVKQEPFDRHGEVKGDLWHEWKVHQLLQTHTNLKSLLPFVSEMIHFDEDHAIAIVNYLSDYGDLDDFYTQHKTFPPAIAAALGRTLAVIHQATLDQSIYQHFLEEGEPEAITLDLRLETQLTPEELAQISEEGLKFYALCQRYESLNQAIVQLQACQEPCCLTHQDLKFNNILLHQNWESCGLEGTNNSSPDDSPIRLIDWEKWAWGDPASDLGMLIAGYLKIWLKSLMLRSGIEIHLALQWAGMPLEELQPSIVALVQAYLAAFPGILSRFPQILPRTMQFTGLALIESLQAKLHYREPFGNTEIGMLQVAKTLLCAPEQSIPTVFGISATELIRLSKEKIPPGETVLHRSVSSNRSPTVQQDDDRTNLQSSAPSTSPISQTQQWTQAEMLQDLVQHIQIRSDGAYHPHYPLPTVEKLQDDRLQRLPANLHQQYLRIQLRDLIYDLYFSGELGIAARQEDFGVKAIENNTAGGLNLRFFEQIQSSNHGTGYWDDGWQVQQEENGRYAVQKAGLTILVEPQHFREENRSPQISDMVEILLPSYRMDGDFYVAIGNAGLPPEDHPTLEICFHVSPIGVLALMRHLTAHLNQQQIPFRLKAITDPAEDGRYDAAVLNLECRHYPQLRQILQTVYSENRSHFYPAVPLMTKPIAPGIGLAEEPEGETFGIDRCQIIADVLIDIEILDPEMSETQTSDTQGRSFTAQKKQLNQQQANLTRKNFTKRNPDRRNNSRRNIAEKRLAAIEQRFIQQGVNWQSPYLNDKVDYYETIDT